VSHRIIAVTPAGRERYLELLSHYILRDPGIDEWHLWDNCRSPKDRRYIEALASRHAQIKVIRIEGADGTNLSVNRFYPLCNDDRAFYIKLDDDIVYLPDRFGSALYERAIGERDRFLWWSPLVINNAICSWLIKHHSKVELPDWLSCQANDPCGWRDPHFAERLHRKFLSAIRSGGAGAFQVPAFDVSLSRFSINCLGFFGADVAALGGRFCPPDVDDEEWLSACLPSILHRPGRVVGDLVVAHFSFFTQETELLKAGVLDRYYDVAGLRCPPCSAPARPIRQRVFLTLRALKRSWAGA